MPMPVDDEEVCSICLEPMPEPPPLKNPSSTLCCGHRFHTRCCDELFYHNADYPLCPLCRAPICYQTYVGPITKPPLSPRTPDQHREIISQFQRMMFPVTTSLLPPITTPPLPPRTPAQRREHQRQFNQLFDIVDAEVLFGPTDSDSSASSTSSSSSSTDLAEEGADVVMDQVEEEPGPPILLRGT